MSFQLRHSKKALPGRYASSDDGLRYTGWSTRNRVSTPRVILVPGIALLHVGLAVASLLLLSSCTHRNKAVPAGESQRPNVVLVTIDTLRADRLGCYGNSKIETPHLDGIARSGTLFENAVSHSPLTPPSHASMFTGMYPPVHKVRDTGGFILQPENMTLAEIMQQQGWATGAFVGSAVLSGRFGFSQGFAVYDDQISRPLGGGIASEYPERRAGEVVDRALSWLSSQSGKPFFLWVHLFDPHTPYAPPAPFREKYKERPYDGEIAYTDQELGRLFAGIAKKSPPANTLIAVLADHGESLSEHGEFTHGVFLYDSTLRIPFLLAGPGVPQNQRVKQQVRSIDLAPTLLELSGVKALQGLQGTSLTPALSRKEVPVDFSYAETVFSKINMGWSELRAIRTDRWKYVRAPKPELYDLAKDPGETTNIIGSHPDEVRELEAKLNSVVSIGVQEKVSTTMVDRRMGEQLRSLGYLGGSSPREYQLTGKGIDPKDRLEVLRLLQLATSSDSPAPGAERISLLHRAQSLDSTNPTIYYHLGQELAKSGRIDEALKLYKTGINNGVETAWLYSRLGHLYLRQGSVAEGITSFEKAAQLNPSDGESLSDLGLAYLNSGRIGDAERVFKWAAATGGDYAPAHNGLGLVAIRKQDLSAARSHFEKAVQLDPGLLEAQLNLGRIYKMQGDMKQARARFEVFLANASPAEYSDIIVKIKAELAGMP
jgi:arylsulfatase A-like enzyme/Flp pilus assembly protein TadD